MTFRVDRIPAGAGDRLCEVDADSAFGVCLEIRRIVFTEGQGVPFELEFDGLDEEAQHFLVLRLEKSKSTPVGTGRMRRLGRQAKIERVAVLESARGVGAGRILMNAMEESACASDLHEAVLHAQIAAVSFYEKLGYVAHGSIFEEAGIGHRAMSKRLVSSAD